MPAVVGAFAFGKTIGAPCSQNLPQQDLLKASSRKMADITVDYVFVFLYIVVPAYALLQRVLQFSSNLNKGKSTGNRSSDFRGTL